MYAHIIGVVVREITSDTPTATARVTANSRKSRPKMPPIMRIGMNTARREIVIDKTVKPISLAPSSAAWRGGVPCSRCRMMFSMTPSSSLKTSYGIWSRGHRHAGDDGDAHRAEKDEHHQDDEQDREDQRALYVMHRGAYSRGAIDSIYQGHGRRDRGLQLRQDGAHAVDRVKDIGARLTINEQQDGGFAIDYTVITDVFGGVYNVGDIRQAHRCSLPVGDDH